MDREKQIEEMAKVMCGGCPDNNQCMCCLCATWYNAEVLYKAGYRKEDDIAKEIFDDIKEKLIFNTYGIATISNKTFCGLKKKYSEES